MAGEVTVPTVPALATIPDVELVQAGQWNISTGTVTFTPGDLASAVAALDCPAIRRPVLKLGHDEPDPGPDKKRWDGEPAVGYIDNMALADDGFTIVGDYAGMPSWLGTVAASAYPDRSIEAYWDWHCQLGHTHPFVITAVALLGVQMPGVGTLQSLQDVAALYGVAAAADQVGQRVAVTVHASKGDEAPMPNPRPLQIAAAVSSEDVRRQYYENAPWSVWICEMQLDPLQLITVDDDSGQYARVPIVLDGDTVTFGEAVPVRIEYVDMPAPAADGTPAAASAGRVVFASRAESRPGERPTPPVAAAQDPPAAPAVEDTKEGAAMDAALLRQALGLSPEATDDEVTEALASNGLSQPAETDGTTTDGDPTPEGEDAPAELVSASQLPAGTVAIDEATLAALRSDAEDGRAARQQQLTEARDTAISAAIGQGKIPPARRAHWEAAWKADPEGAKATLASLAPGLVPLADNGAPGGEEIGDPLDAEIDRLFRPTARKEA